MNKISYKLIAISSAALIMLACGKKNSDRGSGDIPPIVLLQSWISDGPWQLISFTRSDASGIISRYQGNVMDTLQFGYTLDSNQDVVRTGAGFNIQGVYTVCSYQLHIDSTITLGPLCRANYNDTIKVTSFSEYLTVFKVKFDSANIHGWEIDSLKKIHLTP